MTTMKIWTSYNHEESSRYDERRFRTPQGLAFQLREMEQLTRYLKYVPLGCKVLEVGCGTGRFCVYLGSHGYDVTGIDPSPYMVDIASIKCANLPNVRIHTGEGMRLRAEDNTFDFVMSIRVINKTGSRQYALGMIREMVRVVKPEGHILVEYLNSWRPRISNDVFLSRPMIAKMFRTAALPAKILAHSGILILSHRAFAHCPSGLLPVVVWADRVFSTLLPHFTDRSYVLIKKYHA